MEMIRCTQCEKDFGDEFENCPHCGALSPRIPNYPRFKGGGAFMVMWIFFVVLIIVLLVTMFTN